ncbi:MAG: ABC transporter ATP-binding protein [Proteobacteria bacterium]|nr:MAG: ABC transporter ATP-binding protein [Pseudomonadota bacterium]
MKNVRLEGLCKSFGDIMAVDNVNLTVEEGEFVVLVGPSGCGKTTTLRMLAGLEDSTSGRIYIGDRDVTDVHPKDRNIAMVFQSYALYPHKTVAQNLGFALKLAKRPQHEIDRSVSEAAKILDIEDLLDRKPAKLSGGQRQRVAVGRAITRNPDVFLFDEPLSNLDAKLRTTTRSELIKLHKRLNATMVYVTHDQVEAMTMGDRIVVMEGGIVQQIGTPLEIYDNPDNRFVAGFIGSPAMNFLDARVVSNDSGCQARFAGTSLPLPKNHPAASRSDVVLSIRPEHLEISPGPEKSVQFQATIEAVEHLGAETLVELGLDGKSITVKSGRLENLASDQTIQVGARPEQILVFDAGDGRRLRESSGDAQ